MKTLSEQFVEKKVKVWKKLREILSKIHAASYEALTPEEIRDFPRLYRLVCADLAEAGMRKLSPDVISYLNQLVGYAHQILYSFIPLKQSDLVAFFKERLPKIVLEFWPYVLTSALAFIIPLIGSFIIVSNNPETARIIVDQATLEQMEKSYQEGFTEKRVTGEGAFALSYYIQHNVTIAFFSFAAGLLIGIGTLYFLIYNGIILGSIGGYVVGIGYGKNFFHFVCAHSIFELSGLILVGAAGLLLGYSLINPGQYFRRDWLRFQKNSILSLVCAGSLLIFLAAIIESNISPHPIPLGLKIFIASLCLLSLLSYFLALPFLSRRRGDAA